MFIHFFGRSTHLTINFYEEVLRRSLVGSSAALKDYLIYPALHPLYSYLHYWADKIFSGPIVAHKALGIFFSLTTLFGYFIILKRFTLLSAQKILFSLMFILGASGFCRLHLDIEDNIFFHGPLLFYLFFFTRSGDLLKDSLWSGFFLAISMLMNIITLVVIFQVLLFPYYLYKKQKDIAKKSVLTTVMSFLFYEAIRILLFSDFIDRSPFWIYLTNALTFWWGEAIPAEGIVPRVSFEYYKLVMRGFLDFQFIHPGGNWMRTVYFAFFWLIVVLMLLVLVKYLKSRSCVREIPFMSSIIILISLSFLFEPHVQERWDASWIALCLIFPMIYSQLKSTKIKYALLSLVLGQIGLGGWQVVNYYFVYTDKRLASLNEFYEKEAKNTQIDLLILPESLKDYDLYTRTLFFNARDNVYYTTKADPKFYLSYRSIPYHYYSGMPIGKHLFDREELSQIMIGKNVLSFQERLKD